MCGIAGEIAFRGSRAETKAVAAMTAALASRGPDGDGRWTNGWVSLGHRRLSVIDLSAAGAQPMVDKELGLAVVFNGCIFNHHELRCELERRYTFTSTSDTEVILKAYDRWGENFVDHVVGMFAVAVVDERLRRVVFARDRLGIKPLYTARVDGRLRFASTLPALLAGGGIDQTLDASALHHFLTWHTIVPAPRTILQGVEKLPAATIRVVDFDGSQRDRVYWQPDYVRDPDLAGWSLNDWSEALHHSLLTAVQRQMVSDIPVGVLLSGGLDSSLLVALLSEAGQHTVSTFSIGFDGTRREPGDEFEQSDLVAQIFGADHHRLHVGLDDLVAGVDCSVQAMTEPMGSHDVAAFYLLSKSVSEHVKVVQTGQGADEIFAGYAYHQPAATVHRGLALETFIKAFADRDHAVMSQVLEPDYCCDEDSSRNLLAACMALPGAETALDAVLRLDTHLLMVDDPVKRLDSMTMAWGLEARVPFLDQDLVALAAACPPEFKAAHGGKWVLKALGRRLLPSAIVNRPKRYFPVPALRLMEEPFLTMVKDALYAPEAKRRKLYRPEYIETLLSDPSGNFTPVNANALWQLAILEMWLQQHGISA